MDAREPESFTWITGASGTKRKKSSLGDICTSICWRSTGRLSRMNAGIAARGITSSWR